MIFVYWTKVIFVIEYPNNMTMLFITFSVYKKEMPFWPHQMYNHYYRPG